jgi:hypothetical protein
MATWTPSQSLECQGAVMPGLGRLHHTGTSVGVVIGTLRSSCPYSGAIFDMTKLSILPTWCKHPNQSLIAPRNLWCARDQPLCQIRHLEAIRFMRVTAIFGPTMLSIELQCADILRHYTQVPHLVSSTQNLAFGDGK